MLDPNPLREVFVRALLKFELGAAKYGPFDPETDQRDLLLEAESEILDALNYLAMYLIRIRTMRDTPPCCRPGCSCGDKATGCHDTAGK